MYMYTSIYIRMRMEKLHVYACRDNNAGRRRGRIREHEYHVNLMLYASVGLQSNSPFRPTAPQLLIVMKVKYPIFTTA